MARDETRDVFVLTEDGCPEMSDCCISVVEGTIRDEVASDGQAETRYAPHSDLVDLERQFAEVKAERDYWRKKHQEDNEGLVFHLGRNLEFAQEVAFRHGATEPHPTIKCIQIIDKHAESLRHQLANRDATIEAQRSMLAGSVDSAFGLQPVMTHEELCLTVERETSDRKREYANELTRLQGHIAERDNQMQAFIRKASEVPGLSATLDQVTWERDQLRKTLADREDAIRKLQEAMNELRSESDSMCALLVRVVKYSTEDEVKSRRATRFERLLDEITRALESKP